MVGQLIRAAEAPISLSISVARKSVELTGRVAGWALTEIVGVLSPDRQDGSFASADAEPASTSTWESPAADEPVAVTEEAEVVLVTEEEPEVVSPSEEEQEAAKAAAEEETLPSDAVPARKRHRRATPSRRRNRWSARTVRLPSTSRRRDLGTRTRPALSPQQPDRRG